ncbi:hypothetical protein FML24_24220 [Klebsiella oxytoca]|nr:hypothetical protein [Klebsiella oxytoca]MBZ7696398.1 hypothetical protein [Klebsiella oxytoca]
MRRICPGYRPADGTEPVARARRVKRRPREHRAEWVNFPEAMLRICPGYRTADGTEPVARARRVARRPRSRAQSDRVSRRRCCASVRVTGPQTASNP